eukprot:SAG31_NODE_4015_length_3662_cov_4.196464_2_plen_349_part_00
MNFTLDGLDYGSEVWAWTPFRHEDGSWHAYYTWVRSPACTIMYARPDPPTRNWTASRPILQWKTVSKLLSVEGECYYDNRIQVDGRGKLYLITNHPSGPGTDGDVSILALPMASPSQIEAGKGLLSRFCSNQLLEKYRTFIARCNALIEKVSPCIGWARSSSVLLQPDLPKLNSERRDPGSVSIVENTQIQQIHGTYVLFYSVGDYALANYKIGLAFSKSLLGPYSKVYKNDTKNVWNNSMPAREVHYLMQSSAPDWPNYMNRFLSGPGIASLVNTTTNGPALLFHARHPNNQGLRYLWLFSYLSLKPGEWDISNGATLGDLIKLGGSCAPPYTSPSNPSECKLTVED